MMRDVSSPLQMTGVELKEIRRRLGLTQQQLAERLGIQRNSLARQERGEIGISEPVARLAKGLAAPPRSTQSLRPGRTGMTLSIVKHRAGHRLVTTDGDGQDFTFALYPTRERAARALSRLARINEAHAIAMDIVEEAIRRVRRAARVPLSEAVDALVNALAIRQGPRQ